MKNFSLRSYFSNRFKYVRVICALNDNGFGCGYTQTANEPALEEKKKLLLEVFLDLYFGRPHQVGSLPWFAFFNSLRESEHEAILTALSECIEEGYLIEFGSYVKLNPNKFQETMDFVGVWFEGYEPYASAA